VARERPPRGLAFAAALLLYPTILYVLNGPLNLYAASLAAGLAGALAFSALDAAVEVGLAGLLGYLIVLALDHVPGYLWGYARIVGATAVVIGLSFSFLLPGGVAVLAWHAGRRLRGRGARG